MLTESSGLVRLVYERDGMHACYFFGDTPLLRPRRTRKGWAHGHFGLALVIDHRSTVLLPC